MLKKAEISDIKKSVDMMALEDMIEEVETNLKEEITVNHQTVQQQLYNLLHKNNLFS